MFAVATGNTGLGAPWMWEATKRAAPQMPEGRRPVCIQSRFMDLTMRSAVLATCASEISRAVIRCPAQPCHQEVGPHLLALLGGHLRAQQLVGKAVDVQAGVDWPAFARQVRRADLQRSAGPPVHTHNLPVAAPDVGGCSGCHGQASSCGRLQGRSHALQAHAAAMAHAAAWAGSAARAAAQTRRAGRVDTLAGWPAHLENMGWSSRHSRRHSCSQTAPSWYTLICRASEKSISMKGLPSCLHTTYRQAAATCAAQPDLNQMISGAWSLLPAGGTARQGQGRLA